ncbi:MAG TPA: DoxX family membrane protein [Puia sp.]|nr:DoxX family membrane protein [Puia sp.]
MSTSKSINVSVIAARILLGLIFFVFGLNFFFHFIPSGPQPEGKAGAFIGGLFQSGYLFQLIKTVEVLAGILLLTGLYVPLVLVVLMPISLNIFLFHSLLQPSGAAITISSLILLLQFFLAWQYRNYYKQLFIAKPAL